MMFCRITFLIWMTLGLGITLAKHGFGITLISYVLQLLLLWGGGFFS